MVQKETAKQNSILIKDAMGYSCWVDSPAASARRLKYLRMNASATSGCFIFTKFSMHFRYEKSALKSSVETT